MQLRFSQSALRLFLSLISITSISLSASLARADKIEFPDDELATESVLPVFDKNIVVRNRAITTAKRFEVGAGFGLSLIEALYNNVVYGFNGVYNIDETRAIHVMGMFQQSGLSSNGEKLQSGNFSGQNPFDPSLAPSPEYYIFGNYQLTAYYGKISLSKQKSLNLSLFGLFGLGMVSFGDTTEPALNVGFGQKFYFNKNLALRLDLCLSMFQGPDPTKFKGGGNLSGIPKQTSDQFESTLFFRSFLTAGLVYLL